MKIQIDDTLFAELVRYHVFGYTDHSECIRSALEAKLDALVRRSLYTDSKTAKTHQEREKARQAYLDSIGMADDFRWPEGFSPRT